MVWMLGRSRAWHIVDRRFAGGVGCAPVQRRKGNLPKIAGGTDELDARRAFGILGSLDANHAAILMLLSVAIDQPENLADGNSHCQDYQSTVSANALHLR